MCEHGARVSRLASGGKQESKRLAFPLNDFVYSKSASREPGEYFSVAPGYYRSRRTIPIMAGSQSRMMRQR